MKLLGSFKLAIIFFTKRFSTQQKHQKPPKASIAQKHRKTPKNTKTQPSKNRKRK